MAFQDLYRGQIYSEQPCAEALAAGTIVSLGASGWAKAADETKARGVLLVDVVAAPTADAEGINIYDGGVVGAAQKVYVGNEAPVDIGNPTVLTDVVAAGQEWANDDPVYCGNGILYKTAQNSGAAIGRVVKVEGDEIKVKFRFSG